MCGAHPLMFRYRLTLNIHESNTGIGHNIILLVFENP